MQPPSRNSPAFRWLEQNATWLIFAVAFGVRLAYIFLAKSYLSIETAEMVRVARSLAEAGTFSDAFGDGSGPTTYAPVYPLLLSFLYRMTDSVQSAQIIQEVFTAFYSSIPFAMLPTIAALGGLGRRAGVAGGLLGAILPARMWMETKGSWEVSFASLLLLLSVYLTLKGVTKVQAGEGWIQWAALRGVIWGLAMLTSPSLLIFFLIALGLELYLSGHLRRSLAAVILVGGLAGLTMLPWTVRNYRVFDELFFVRGTLGLELAVSNNSVASPLGIVNDGLGIARRHPFTNPDELRRYKELGEVNYAHERMAEARAWIAGHPGEFMVLTGKRVFYFWFVPAKRLPQTLALAAITIGAWVGMALSLRRRSFLTLWIAFAWLLFPLLYYLVQVDVRYPYPLYWSLLTMFGVVLARLALRFGFAEPEAPESRPA